jgi:hypothetical protein
MGIKAHLLRELETMMSADASADTLGQWMIRNSGQVREALDMSDDLVAIQEIDLANPATWPEDMRRQAFPQKQTATG